MRSCQNPPGSYFGKSDINGVNIFPATAQPKLKKDFYLYVAHSTLLYCYGYGENTKRPTIGPIKYGSTLTAYYPLTYLLGYLVSL